MPATAFIIVTPAMRRALESLVDDLVLLLDEIDGDADFEDMNEDGTDLDLGEHDDREELEHTAPERYGRGFVRCGADDEEPSLGSVETGLFSTFGFSQAGWSRTGTDDLEFEWDGPADADALALEYGEDGRI